MAFNLKVAYSANLSENVRWGRKISNVLDWFKNPAGGTGPKGTGRPILLYRHTAGGAKGEFYNTAGHPLYRLVDYLFGGAANAALAGTRAVPFDFVSIQTPQRSVNAPNPPGEQRYFPGQVYEYQKGAQMVRAMAADYGCDPNLIVNCGSSMGALLALQACLLQPAFGMGGLAIDRRTIYDARGYSAIPKALLLVDGVYDFRKLATSNGITFTGGTWNEGSKTITAVGAFATYRWTAGDKARITSGTNATLGEVEILSSTADTIVLASSIGASASAVAGQVPTDQIDLTTCGLLFGHYTALASSWDSIPAALKAAASPRAWAAARKMGRLPPCYFQASLAGNGLTPYGNSGAGTNPHDPKQAQDMAADIVAAGRSAIYNFTLRTAWNGTSDDSVVGTTFADSKRLYDWLVARINDA